MKNFWKNLLATTLIWSDSIPLVSPFYSDGNVCAKHILSKQETIYEVNEKKFNLYSEVFSDSLVNYYPELGQKLLNQLSFRTQSCFHYSDRDSDGKPFVSWKSSVAYPDAQKGNIWEKF